MANSVELKVSGMTCMHCEMHVKEELSALDGVNSVDVELKPGEQSTVRVGLDADVSDDALREAVDEAGGYTVESIVR
ncbi:MAG: heavy-metal-associated domain-containing protein [Actinomycetaceae bacterium]|nr:heavy-metal-associated domain-containing protein [Arcanobacterium sp.]MDD7687582.1 heavy-metal-associated domain-containing protein [Actinomycetaceae bacterium]MDY5273180.1 heavy-metal-associated domain-containing protein [Arcanobacterium sp.]